MSDILSTWRARPLAAFWGLAALITGLRVVTLVLTDANLGPDEAQYWFWAQEFAFGYYSKPPLIGWTIAATTAVFGDAEWAVRLAAPFFHLGAALFLYALARRLYDARIAFWAGLGWLVMPGVALSAVLITTDAPLLFFWSTALYFFFRMTEAEASRLYAPLLGAAVGLGLMSKYAMIYFPLGAALALVLAPALRRGLRVSDIAVAVAVAALAFAPNVLWNARNDFHTVSHTAANANWNDALLHPVEMSEFVLAQAGVFGPLAIGLFIWGGLTLARRLGEAGTAREHDLALLAFTLPPIAIVTMQALISRAHANWAAAAYPAAMILVTAWALRAGKGRLAKASVALHAGAVTVFLIAISSFPLADAAGASRPLGPVRGWEELGAEVQAAAAGYDAVLVDDREVMGPMLYYARGAGPFMALDSNRRVEHHYEAFIPLDPARARRALFVSTLDEKTALLGRYETITRLGEIAAPLGGGDERRLYLYEAEGPLDAR